VLANLTAFSGTGIKIITRDSIIPLPKAVARENVKELIRKDSLETEISVLKNNYSLLEQNNSYKDTIIESKSRQIDLYKEKEKNYLTIIELKDEQKKNLEELTKSLNKEIKKMKLNSLKNTAISSIIIIGLTYFLLK
jgi:hypothetical protein